LVGFDSALKERASNRGPGFFRFHFHTPFSRVVPRLPAVFHPADQGRTVFAQLAWRESLRDVETCLAFFGPRLHHSGCRHPIARSTRADANETRDYYALAQRAIPQLATLYPRFRGEGLALFADYSCAPGLDRKQMDFAPAEKYRRRKAKAA